MPEEREVFANPSVDELIKQQGKGPIGDPRILLGDFWPEEESIDDFLRALRDWRGHDRIDHAT